MEAERTAEKVKEQQQENSGSTDGKLYSNGGDSKNAKPGGANTGDGGGGRYGDGAGAAGGSGIVVIRNSR